MMASKWSEYAQKCMAPDEHRRKSYPGRLDGDFGYLIISDKKLLFVKEEGFLRKKYSAPFSLAYDKVQDVRPLDSYHLLISEKTGKSHKFECDTNVSSVAKVIHEEMNTRVRVPM